MWQNLFRSADLIRWLSQSLWSPYLNEFATFLGEQHYSTGTIRRALVSADHLACWLSERQLSPSDTGPATVPQYRDSLDCSARQQLAGGVVDHRDQIQLLPGLPANRVRSCPTARVHHAAAALPPHMHVLDRLLLGSPEPCLRHDLPQRLASDPQAVIFGQVVAG